MTNGNTADRRAAWCALASVDDADAYLRALPDPRFIAELRAEWVVNQQHPYTAPASTREVKRLVASARGQAQKLWAACQPGPGPRLNAPEGVRRWLERLAKTDLSGPAPVANPITMKLRRLLSVEDPKLRFARQLARCAASLSHDTPGGPYRVTGRMAAVMAVALGVEAHVRVTKRAPNFKDAAELRIREWDKRTAAARVQLEEFFAETREG